jgi:hypothetical protein
MQNGSFYDSSSWQRCILVHPSFCLCMACFSETALKQPMQRQMSLPMVCLCLPVLVFSLGVLPGMFDML